MIQAERKALSDAVDLLERNAHRTHNAVQIEAADGVVTLRGGAPGFYAEVRLDADVREPLRADLPATPFKQALRAMPGDAVTLDPDENRIRLESGASSMAITVINRFEETLTFPDAYHLTFPDNAFTRGVDATAYAVSRAEYQSGMRGLLLDVQGNTAAFVGTDGFRLARALVDIEGNGEAYHAILPLRTVTEIARACHGTIRLHVTPERVYVEADGVRVDAALDAAQFPDYQKVIPGQFTTVLAVSSDALLDAVKRAAILSDRTSNHRVDLHLRDGQLRLTSSGPYGSGQEDVPVERHSGEQELAIPVNGAYLQHALAQVDGTAVLRFNGPLAPFVLSPADNDNLMGLIVPLRTA